MGRRAGSAQKAPSSIKPVRTAVRKASTRSRRGQPAAKPPKSVSPVLRSLTEAEFQKEVVASLEGRGWIVWHVPDSRRMKRGLPDLLCIHPMKPGLLLAYEIKPVRGRVRPEQTVALACLSTVKRVDARIVRPEDWAEILRGLDR